jgi:phage shock protein C
MATGTTKRIYRSRRDKILGGVCGGLAEYFKVDSLIVRGIWILLILMAHGAPLLIYILAWILMPTEKTAKTQSGVRRAKATEITPQHRGLFVGLVLIIVGVLALAGQTATSFILQMTIAIGLILLGVLAITGAFKNGFNTGNGR